MSYIKISVSKPWNGMVAVREKYVTQALNEGKGLNISFAGKYMLVAPELVTQWHTKTGKVYKDNFSKEMHALVYYKVPVDGHEYMKTSNQTEPVTAVESVEISTVECSNPQATLFDALG